VEQRTKLSAQRVLSVKKHSDNTPPKAGKAVDHRDDVLNQSTAFKLNCLTSLWEKLTKQLQLKANTAVNWGKQQL
jgi:hypothetical protein